ncbi:uncharacterized protein LOC135216617 [Macrobrachium nipponense]|uniref:uncharacterized protein LOC135216617 n=1 Tax=Macrobrachium nipponense TaxID=159736 RepID=UPI0030C82608
MWWLLTIPAKRRWSSGVQATKSPTLSVTCTSKPHYGLASQVTSQSHSTLTVSGHCITGVTYTMLWLLTIPAELRWSSGVQATKGPTLSVACTSQPHWFSQPGHQPITRHTHYEPRWSSEVQATKGPTFSVACTSQPHFGLANQITRQSHSTLIVSCMCTTGVAYTMWWLLTIPAELRWSSGVQATTGPTLSVNILVLFRDSSFFANQVTSQSHSTLIMSSMCTTGVAYTMWWLLTIPDEPRWSSGVQATKGPTPSVAFTSQPHFGLANQVTSQSHSTLTLSGHCITGVTYTMWWLLTIPAKTRWSSGVQAPKGPTLSVACTSQPHFGLANQVTSQSHSTLTPYFGLANQITSQSHSTFTVSGHCITGVTCTMWWLLTIPAEPRWSSGAQDIKGPTPSVTSTSQPHFGLASQVTSQSHNILIVSCICTTGVTYTMWWLLTIPAELRWSSGVQAAKGPTPSVTSTSQPHFGLANQITSQSHSTLIVSGHCITGVTYTMWWLLTIPAEPRWSSGVQATKGPTPSVTSTSQPYFGLANQITSQSHSTLIVSGHCTTGVTYTMWWLLTIPAEPRWSSGAQDIKGPTPSMTCTSQPHFGLANQVTSQSHSTLTVSGHCITGVTYTMWWLQTIPAEPRWSSGVQATKGPTPSVTSTSQPHFGLASQVTS